MKKVAIISDSCPPSKGGGISTAHYNLFLSLKERGYSVRIFTYLEDNKGGNSESEIFRFGANKYERQWLSIKNVVIRKLQKWVFNSRHEGLAYQHNIVLLANIGVNRINKSLDVYGPDIVIIPDFGAPGVSLVKRRNVKFIYISHNNPIRFLDNPLITLHSKKDAREAINKEQASLHKMDVIVCPSSYMMEVFNQTFSCDKKKVIIPNIVNEFYIKSIKKKNAHEKLRIHLHIPIVYIPSAGSNIKGERYIVEIVRRISKELNGNVAFYLSGELSDCQKYELNILEIENVYSPGNVSYIDNIGYIKDCSICLSPTLMESFGMALLEAMHCGLPCVSFDVGGNREIILDGKNGYLVPYLDVESLIAKSILLLQRKDILEQFIVSVQETNNNLFSTEKIVNNYIELIESL